MWGSGRCPGYCADRDHRHRGRARTRLDEPARHRGVAGPDRSGRAGGGVDAAGAGAVAVPAAGSLGGAGAVGVAVSQLLFFEAMARTGVAVGTLVAIGVGPLAAGLIGLAGVPAGA